MDESRDGYRRFLGVQVETLQERLYTLERDPEQVEPLKAILRVSQGLRHARQADEPEPVRILRNAVEKVTLHLGHADLAVTRDVLDFYVDSFDLLEEAVRRWPGGPSFDRARYADRVRALLQRTSPRGDRRMPAEAPSAGSGAPLEREATVEPELDVEIVLPGPDATGATAEPARAVEAAPVETVPVETVPVELGDVPTWREAGSPGDIEVLGEAELEGLGSESFVEADLRELLAEPWRGDAEAEEAPVVAGVGPAVGPAADAGLDESSGAGGLAASFATYEALRAEPGPEVGAALTRLRDVLDAFSLSLNDLDRASERLLREDWSGLGRDTVVTLVERLEGERDKLLTVFDRTIESFRAGAV